MLILTLKLATLKMFYYLAACFLSHFALQSFILDVFLWRHTFQRFPRPFDKINNHKCFFLANKSIPEPQNLVVKVGL